MSKTNATRKCELTNQSNELTEDELNPVSGGRFGIRANGVEIQQFADGGAGPSAIDAWTTLLHQYGAA